ncbi:MAG TPA: ligase-associated DNA damage response endonuclease PdeM [Puia sp.]|nr:ligase-associated DNA damage response endonuclease PdeM [Puia sp.]
MQAPFSYRIREQQLWLSPERCIFWEEEKALILSDLHFGKTGHFRKSGIAVPPSVYKEDLHRLLAQIQYFQPRQLLIVGDLFHSRENNELDLFRRWRDDLSGVDVRLIKGNHDILEEDWYKDAGIEVHKEHLEQGAFGFIHDITEYTHCSSYCFSGHIHPGIWISGMGRQSLRFPCFYFGETYAVLPAFSRFTGTAAIDPPPGSNVFVILPPEPEEKTHIPRGRGRTASIAPPSAASRRRAGTILQIQ